MPNVSIIIPAHNASATLNATLDSVIAQTHAEWEAIIYDDGSTDDTAHLARQWTLWEPRIRLISDRNHGTSLARNRAAAASNGEWLLFLDADDLIAEHHLARLLQATDGEHLADLVFSSGSRLTPDGRLGSPEVPPKADFFRYLGSYNTFYTHACLVRRTTFDAFGGFDADLAICEDWDLWQRFSRAGLTFARVNESSALYRMRPQSLSHDVTLLFANARKVIERAHGRDPRVRNPAPQYAEGLPREHLADAILGIAMWSAALMLGARKNPLPFLEGLAIQPASEGAIAGAVSMMQGGVPAGACCLQEDWPALMPVLEPLIREAFVAIEGRCKITNFGARCMQELERRLGPPSYQDGKKPRSAMNPTRGDIPAIGSVQFGDLHRTDPISTNWGYDRGDPLDRFYIEGFLQRHCHDICGRVLEVGDNAYTLRFGSDRVVRSDVLHVDQNAKNATIVADLAKADHIESEIFDCIILTQTLQLVSDVLAAVATLHRILRPGGILLLTVPAISPIDHGPWRDTWFWSFTTVGLRKLLAERFPLSGLNVESRGNVFAATAFLYGLSQQDVPTFKYQLDDPHYPVTVLARAVKPLDAPQ